MLDHLILSFRTQYIENREYSHKEIIDIINNYNESKAGLVAIFFPIDIALMRMVLKSEKIGYHMAPDVKYTGVEFVNFLNEFSKLSVWSIWYITNKKEVVNKLLYHQYSSNDALTLDDTSWLNWPWPGAVLNIYRRDLPNIQNHIDEVNDSNDHSVRDIFEINERDNDYCVRHVIDSGISYQDHQPLNFIDNSLRGLDGMIENLVEPLV